MFSSRNFFFLEKIRSAVKLESLGDWCCLIKNKLILLYSAVMIGTQTCSQVPMNPRYIQYYTYSIHRDKYLFGQKLVSKIRKLGSGPVQNQLFSGASEPLLEPRNPASNASQQYRLCTNTSARGTTFHTPNWTSMHLAVYFGPVRNLATLFFWTWPGFWRSWEKDAKREFWGPFMFFSRVYSLGMLGVTICDRGPPSLYQVYSCMYVWKIFCA